MPTPNDHVTPECAKTVGENRGSMASDDGFMKTLPSADSAGLEIIVHTLILVY